MEMKGSIWVKGEEEFSMATMVVDMMSKLVWTNARDYVSVMFHKI